MRYFFLVFLLSIVAVVGIFGFRGDRSPNRPIEIFNDMDHQAKVKAQNESAFFADGLGARMPVPRTLPVGYVMPEKPFHEGGMTDDLEFTLSLPEYATATGTFLGAFEGENSYYYSGRIGDFYGSGIPDNLTVDEGFLAAGRESYGVYCAICHGESGNGKGVLQNYMTALIANLHEPRFADPENADYREDGEIFEVITVGRGQMGAYGMSIPVKERWAIVAYIRALQQAKMAADAKDEQPAEPATKEEPKAS